MRGGSQRRFEGSKGAPAAGEWDAWILTSVLWQEVANVQRPGKSAIAAQKSLAA